MGLSKAVALCLTFAVVVNAQGSIFGDLAAKENQLNCLLGKPNCIPPSPPPPVASPPPPTAAPPTTPPGASPPGSSPGSSPPGSTPGSSPPGSTPESGPTPSEGPAPAPGPAPNGNAVAVVSLSFPDGYIVTDAVRQELTNIIQQSLGNSATVELQIGAGRKLLEDSALTLLLTNVLDCADVGAILLRIFGDGSFVRAAQQAGIPLQAASLNGFACTKPGEEPVIISNPPAVAPGASTPAGGPGSVTPPTTGVPPTGTPPTGTPPTGAPTPGVPSPAPAGR